MTAITTPIISKIPQLRPLNVLRDLPAVADIVEKCFANTMDAEGHRYIQQMRRAGQDNAFLRWATLAVETASVPLSGFVWEENGSIIGNVSLIPFNNKRKHVYLIANVAVHPDHRRRGIGRALTVAAMNQSQRRHADAVWLHVRDDNPGAIELYRNLGFVELARRTMWEASPERNKLADNTGISKRSSYDWYQQGTWLQRLYPDILHWYQPVPWKSLRPGLGAAFYRFMMDYDVRHWVSRIGNEPSAIISWQAMAGQNDRLWAAVPQEGSDTVLTALLIHARRALFWRRELTLDFPAGEYQTAIEAAGFHAHRTLLWMKLQPQIPVNQ